MVNLEVKEDVSSVHDINFEAYAFARFKSRLECGVSLREFFRLSGCWFSLEKSVARRLLHVFEQDFGLKRRYRNGNLELALGE